MSLFNCNWYPLPAGSVKVWDFGSGQEIKVKAGKGAPEEDLSVLGIRYVTYDNERCLLAIGWNNHIRVMLVSMGHALRFCIGILKLMFPKRKNWFILVADGERFS